jgi:protein SCO1/2
VEYRWVGQAQQYSHPAVLVLATPEGKISRYLRGVRTDPQTLRLSLVEASGGKIGTTADAFLLTCFQYDGKQGKYAWAASFMMKCAGALTMLILGGLILRHLWHKNREDDSGFGPMPPRQEQEQ